MERGWPVVIFGILLSVPGLGGCEHLVHPAPGFRLTEAESRFISSLPPLRVEVDDSFVPLSLYDRSTATYRGISVDLFRAIADDLRLTYRMDHDPTLTWAGKLARFQGGQADLLVPASITPDRAQKGIFTVPFYESSYVAVARKARAIRLADSQGLASHRLGAVRDVSILPYLSTVVPADQIVLVDDSVALYRGLREGRYDLALQNQTVFQEDRYNQELFDLEAVHTLTESPRRYAFYFTKTPEGTALAALFNRYLTGAEYRALVSLYERGGEELILRYTAQKQQFGWLVVILGASALTLGFLGVVLVGHRRLRESEARFKALHDASFGGIAIHDRGLILDCNQGLSDLTGYTREELIGLNGLELVASADRDMVRGYIREGYTAPYQVEGLRKDGSRFPLRVRGKDIPYRGKSVRVTEFRDLTDQKQAERALFEAKRQYDDLVAKIPVGIYQLSTDRDGLFRFDFVSPRMAEIIGIPPSALVTDSSLSFAPIHPEDRPGFEAGIRDHIQNPRPFDWRGRVAGSPGPRWIQIHSSPEAQAGGATLWHGTVADVTDQKQAEDRIGALLAEKDLILREVHHRIKNNMSVITGLLTLQAAALSDPVAVVALEDSRNRVLSMMVLYDKLYRSEGLGAVGMATYLPDLTAQILGHFPNASRVRFKVSAEDFLLDADRVSTLGILLNELLTNAMKHAFPEGREGAIEVWAGVREGAVVLTVNDDGIGLPADLAPDRQSGFGLGLVELLAQHLGGELRIARENGTRFEIKFPFGTDWVKLP